MKNLFALSNVNTSWNGYFIDKMFNVFSNKSGVIKQLQGSRSSGTYNRTFTLNGRTVTHMTIKAMIVDRADMHSRFRRDTGVDRKEVVAPAQTLDASDLGLSNAIKGRGTVIASVVKGKLVLGSVPKIHPSDSEAQAEMIRLAHAAPGTKFVMLKITGSAVLGGLIVE